MNMLAFETMLIAAGMKKPESHRRRIFRGGHSWADWKAAQHACIPPFPKDGERAT